MNKPIEINLSNLMLFWPSRQDSSTQQASPQLPVESGEGVKISRFSLQTTQVSGQMRRYPIDRTEESLIRHFGDNIEHQIASNTFAPKSSSNDRIESSSQVKARRRIVFIHAASQMLNEPDGQAKRQAGILAKKTLTQYTYTILWLNSFVRSFVHGLLIHRIYWPAQTESKISPSLSLFEQLLNDFSFSFISPHSFLT